MFLPIANYVVEVQGSSEKEVHCEGCGEEYSYCLHRKATGNEATVLFLFSSWARRRAEDHANRNLLEKLANDHDNVPCPHCGQIQSAMLGAIREMSLVSMRNLGSAFIYLAIVLSSGLLGWLAVSVIILQNPLPDVKILKNVTIMMLFVFGIGFAIQAFRSFSFYFPAETQCGSKLSPITEACPGESLSTLNEYYYENNNMRNVNSA